MFFLKKTFSSYNKLLAIWTSVLPYTCIYNIHVHEMMLFDSADKKTLVHVVFVTRVTVDK